MGFSEIGSAAIWGMEVIPVQVEADVSSGLPFWHMVGYLSSEVREASERVRTAIQNSGFSVPASRIVINLSPGDLRKRGTNYDLPIALGILAAAGFLRQDILSEFMAVGELGLDGDVCAVNGILPIADLAKQKKIRCLIVPKGNEKEARLIHGLKVYGASDLKSLCRMINTKDIFLPSGKDEEVVPQFQREQSLDFADIKGQPAAKRAAEIAVAGRHHMLMVGPPGSGKSMIAKRIPSILPQMSAEEQLQATRIYSIAGMVNPEMPLICTRPFREVHQTVTKTGLIGGGRYPKPGEITLASGGVLFLDELAEFPRQVLEVLRQPLEDHVVRIARHNGTYEYPADIMLIGAMNPCPCGYYPDLNRCRCSMSKIRQYQARISQPFLSRIDICIEVSGMQYEELEARNRAESSDMIRRRIEQARSIQKDRNNNKLNGDLTAKELEEICWLDNSGKRMMRQAYQVLNMNARVYHKVLRVARTIADLECEERIGIPHLQEAISYRNAGQFFGGAV